MNDSKENQKHVALMSTQNGYNCVSLNTGIKNSLKYYMNDF
jgi:hypothetical protein